MNTNKVVLKEVIVNFFLTDWLASLPNSSRMGKCISLETESLLISLTFILRLSYVYSSSHFYDTFKISTTGEKSFKSLPN